MDAAAVAIGPRKVYAAARRLIRVEMDSFVFLHCTDEKQITPMKSHIGVIGFHRSNVLSRQSNSTRALSN
jgi:hypothetical protein